ncbi:hypothetical protein, partial [Streptococcus pyogenes]|uniref:hypothetical protein n=1 Tax=Streptococcus pyogenes TaxID=1314 RepID=UPI001D131651
MSKIELGGAIFEGDFSVEKSRIWGATTTPHIVPSANFKKKQALALEPQGFSGCEFSASFRRVFGR